VRKHTDVELDPGRSVRVHELRVRDARAVLDALQSDLLERPAAELLREQLPQLLGLVRDTLELPAGEDLDDLSLSECQALGAAWWALHRDFFLPALGVLRGVVDGTETAATLLRPPPSDSSSADTSRSGTTAGAAT